MKKVWNYNWIVARNSHCSTIISWKICRYKSYFVSSKEFILVSLLLKWWETCNLVCFALTIAFFLQFSGKSVGIIGLGRIGSAIAKRAEAFNCPISYYSRSPKPHPNYRYYTSVVELAHNSQILVVSCSLTEETHHITNREVIDALGPKGILINIGRGAHVDEPELVSALLEGRIGGAGLDVFESKPEVPEELFGLKNVVLLPHVGSDTEETSKAMADLVMGNLEAHFLRKPLLTAVIWLVF